MIISFIRPEEVSLIKIFFRVVLPDDEYVLRCADAVFGKYIVGHGNTVKMQRVMEQLPVAGQKRRCIFVFKHVLTGTQGIRLPGAFPVFGIGDCCRPEAEDALFYFIDPFLMAIFSVLGFTLREQL